MKKKIGVVNILIVILMLFTSICFASDISILGDVGMKAPTEGFADIVNGILGIVQWIGFAIAIGMLIMVGVKYTQAAAGERADLKAAMVKYVIGAFLIAGAATVIKWIYAIAKI